MSTPVDTTAPPVAAGGRSVPTSGHGPAEVLWSLERLAAVHGRRDLVDASRQARERLGSTRFRVVLVGEYKKGKSSLLNGLLGARVSAVDDDVATVAPVEVGHSEAPVARIWIDDGGGDLVDEVVPVEEAVSASGRDGTRLVRVGLPRRLLETGLVLVDTPGVGGLSSASAMVTASTLADAHAVVFVTDAGQELTRTEVEALAVVTERCPEVALVETKIDVQPHWREVVEADRAHLAARGFEVPVLAVATGLRERALDRDDLQANEESGYPELLGLISGRFAGSAREIIEQGGAVAARRILHHLRQPLEAERRALEEGLEDDAGGSVAAAAAELSRFRERAGGWQQVLSDGMADLAAEVDRHLREGFRTLARELDETIDDADPDAIWDELGPRVHRRAAEVVDANREVLRQHVGELAARLGLLIDAHEPMGSGIWDDRRDVADVDHAPGVGGGDDGPALELGGAVASSTAARAHQAFRAGYGGAMPVMVVGGMALGVLGIGTLVLPLAGVAGALAGRRAVADDRERQLKQRRQQAKAAVRGHLEEVLSRASHESRATRRRIQRGLRDATSERAEQILATRQQALRQAEAATEAVDAQRRRRLVDLEQELVRLDEVALAIRRLGER